MTKNLNTKRIIRLLAGTLALVVVFSGMSCRPTSDSASVPVPVSSQSTGILDLSGETMGTWWSARLVVPDNSNDRDRLQQTIDQTLLAVDKRMSTWRNDSELSLFNTSQTSDWFDVSPELISVVTCGLDVSEKSGGAFDMTVGPVVNLWKFGPDRTPLTRLPNDEELAAVQAKVGYNKLSVRNDPPALRKTIPDLYVDLSAIAKGYAVDCVAEALLAEGVENFMVDVGGELYCHGSKTPNAPVKTPWILGIEVPDLTANQKNTSQVKRLLEGNNYALATSGDYRNYHRVGNVQFSHLIDPRTARPCAMFDTDEDTDNDTEERVASVSVVADRCMTADAWATALFVLGPKDGLAIAERLELPVVFIVRTMNQGKPQYREIISTKFQQEIKSREAQP